MNWDFGEAKRGVEKHDRDVERVIEQAKAEQEADDAEITDEDVAPRIATPSDIREARELSPISPSGSIWTLDGSLVRVPRSLQRVAKSRARRLARKQRRDSDTEDQ